MMEKFEQASVQLSNAVTCNNLILRVMAKLDDEQFELLNQFISPNVDPTQISEAGWEEYTHASTMHLLKTCLSKKEKQDQNANNALQNTSIDIIENFDKLRR